MANLLINTTVGGNAVITTSNIGTYALTSITSANVTTALGFTPYNATNPSGFITSSGSISGNAGTVTNGVYTTGDQTIGGLKTFSSNITNSATADWYMYGFGARGASSGQYGIGLTADIANRTLSFHVPNIAAYSNSGNTPKFGWYSNGSIELMTLQSATGNLVVTGTITGTNIYANDWFRNYQSNEGLYNEATTQHLSSNTNGYWDMSSTTSLSAIRFYTGGHVTSLRGYIYANSSNEIGFLNSAGNWGLRMDNSYNVQVYGALTVGSGTSSDIYMTDTDEGNRRIHCNSGRIGFLSSTNTWGSWAANDGSWNSDQSMRAPIFYDSQDTGYYVDPNGTSNLLKLSTQTMAFNGMNPMSANSPYVDRYNGSVGYRNGTMGVGNIDFNTIFSNWGSGFIDSWGNPANAPGGSTHYIGLQSIHYSELNSNTVYGFQMACAGEADNRFFWRASWPSKRAWVEMIHSGTIGSQSVNYATSAGNAATATTAGALSSMNISQFSNNSGYFVSSTANAVSVNQIAFSTTNYNFTLPPRESIGSMSIKLWDNYFNSSGLGVDYGSLLDIYGRGGHVHSQFYMDAGGGLFYRMSPYAGGWSSWASIWTSSSLTNLNQLTNGPGYITGYTETDTLASVTGRGATTTTSITAERYRGNNSLILNAFTTVNPSSNVFLYSQANDRDSWIYLDSADTGSNWGIYHRQIDSAVGGMEGNSIGFIGGGASALRAYIGLSTGNAYFAGTMSAAGHLFASYNGRNILLKSAENAADAGILLQNSGGSFKFQIYGNGTDYGFLNGNWAAWDIRKTIGGAMYMNDNNSYYLQTNSTSNFYALNIQGSAVVHAGNIGSQTVSNSDMVDGYHASTSTLGNHIVVREGNGYILGNYINMSDNSVGSAVTGVIVKQGDNYYRTGTAGAIQSFLGLGSLAYSSATIPTNNNQLTNGAGYITSSGSITGNASKLNPLSGDSNYKLAYTADGARTNAGEWGRAVMYYVPNGQTYGIRVDRADYADSAGSASQLTKYGDIYGQDWNSYYISGKLIVSAALGMSGANKPPTSYEYGVALSYGEAGGPLWQMYFPENAGNGTTIFRKGTYRTGYNGNWSTWKTLVEQEGNTCTIVGGVGAGLEVHGNPGYNQDPLTYFLLRGAADTSWKAFKVRLTGDAGGQDIEFRRIAENGADSRMWYVPRGANTVNFDYPIVQPSDSRLKDNITPISTPVDKIKSLRGVEFDWNSGEQVGTHDVGLIAQDVEAVLPEAVTTQEDGYKNLAYTKVIPLLVEAMKEQQTMIEALRAEIELLKNK